MHSFEADLYLTLLLLKHSFAKKVHDILNNLYLCLFLPSLSDDVNIFMRKRIQHALVRGAKQNDVRPK